MEQLTKQENFDLVADRCEAQLHGEIRILADRDYKGIWHIEVQEIADEGDEFEGGWEEIDSDGFFTVERKKFEDLDEAAVWLYNRYIGG